MYHYFSTKLKEIIQQKPELKSKVTEVAKYQNLALKDKKRFESEIQK